MTLQSAARIALTKFLCLKQGENVLVVYDEKKEGIANAFVSEAKKLTYRVDSIIIPVPSVSGVEPPKDAADKMKQYDIIVITTSKSISHTNARKDACKSGARVASMPGITEEMMERSLDVNPEEIIALGRKILSRLEGKKVVKITTKKGTDITMSIEGRKLLGAKGGIISESGEWDNLPAGEICLSPAEGTAKGVLVIDKSMAGIGILKSPIRVIVEKGLVTRISGGAEAGRLKKLLERANDPRAYNIAELGIGTNPKAIVTGNILEDEKAIGTAHIAFGNNASLGGNVEVELHLDGVFSAPTIVADSETIINDGKILD